MRDAESGAMDAEDTGGMKDKGSKRKKLKRLSRLELVELIYDIRKDSLNLEDRCRALDEQLTDLKQTDIDPGLTQRLDAIERQIGDALNRDQDYPEINSIEAERDRLSQGIRFRRALRSTISTLIVVAAIAVLISSLFLPVLRVTGTSMEPNLVSGDIIVGVKSRSFEKGQVCSFYFNNKQVLKRVIGTAGDWIRIDEYGNVSVNGVPLEEPYVQELALGICDIEFPCQVPEGRVFVLGDNRETSVDSRSSAVGCVPVDEIVSAVFLRVWPLERAGLIGK